MAWLGQSSFTFNLNDQVYIQALTKYHAKLYIESLTPDLGIPLFDAEESQYLVQIKPGKFLDGRIKQIKDLPGLIEAIRKKTADNITITLKTTTYDVVHTLSHALPTFTPKAYLTQAEHTQWHKSAEEAGAFIDSVSEMQWPPSLHFKPMTKEEVWKLLTLAYGHAPFSAIDLPSQNAILGVNGWGEQFLFSYGDKTRIKRSKFRFDIDEGFSQMGELGYIPCTVPELNSAFTTWKEKSYQGDIPLTSGYPGLTEPQTGIQLLTHQEILEKKYPLVPVLQRFMRGPSLYPITLSITLGACVAGIMALGAYTLPVTLGVSAITAISSFAGVNMRNHIYIKKLIELDSTNSCTEEGRAIKEDQKQQGKKLADSYSEYALSFVKPVAWLNMRTYDAYMIDNLRRKENQAEQAIGIRMK